jgi:para-aminobenzoate synthetase/4-amino-4-deoxychorismate lyase
LRLASKGVEDPWSFFTCLAHDAPYAAFVEGDEFAIVSASPELFFRLDGDRLVCRPMKGTAARGMTLDDDNVRRDALRASTKDQAENVMVTDMLRNDMGRVSQPGSVELTSLYDIEKYPSVWQMTSTISATTDASITAIMAALFPCASITGAPKASSMNIIAQLETSPREIYTGSIGYIAPARKAQFSVAIRTAWWTRASGETTYGVGGGIVWDSDADAEYEECLTKSKVLQGQPARDSFSLLETLRLGRDGCYLLLDLHLQRLANTASYFDFGLDPVHVRVTLARLAGQLAAGEYRVRLLVAADGQLATEHALLDMETPRRRKIRLARHPVDNSNPFLYHKTTHRDVYTRAMRGAGDCDDVLLWNRDGYITETTIANVIRNIGGEDLTPPVECGLLAGTFRQHLLEQGLLREQAMHRDELEFGETLVLVNSVRGRYEAELVG